VSRREVIVSKDPPLVVEGRVKEIGLEQVVDPHPRASPAGRRNFGY
jgi:hypothetical protein